jgi:hypothetical protein
VDRFYALFNPFFSIDVGDGFDIGAGGRSLALLFLLFVPAVLGKLVGAGVPVVRRRADRDRIFAGAPTPSGKMVSYFLRDPDERDRGGRSGIAVYRTRFHTEGEVIDHEE